MARTRFSVAVAAALLAVGLAGCTATRVFNDAKREESREHWDLAVLGYDKAYRAEPENSRFRLALARAKIKAAQAHFGRGRLHRGAGQLDMAAVEFEQSVALDPTNDTAIQELKRTLADIETRRAENQGQTPVERAKTKSRGARASAPMLNPASTEPITASFPEQPVKKIYQFLASAAGINIIFDSQLKDDKYSIEVRDMPFQRALETVMRQAGHFYKVIDDKTILIAQDTNQNRKEYEDLVIRTFFLSNGDVKDVSAMVRNILDLRRIAAIPQLNAIVIRDTADKVAVAEKIIDVNDKAKSEVVVDVELLQLNTDKVVNLGASLSAYSTTGVLSGGAQTASTGTTSGGLKWVDLFKTGLADFNFTVPSITFNFIKNNSDAELLAKPQLRISEGEKAQLTIGQRRPIPVTTINTQQSIGGSGVVPITSFQYQDVGIKIDIEPRVHHNKEVTLKLTIEVSDLAGSVQVPGQTDMPIIGTRTITSTIRLKDGETNFLAGLLRSDDSKAKAGLPFLADLPLIGQLFGNTKTEHHRTDLFLTLTPHIIRAPQITEEDLLPIWVGTENNVSFSGMATRVESPKAPGSPFEGNPAFGQVPPAQPAPPAPAAGTAPSSLIQGSGPNDPFRRDVPKPVSGNPNQPPQMKPQGALGTPAGGDTLQLALGSTTSEMRIGDRGIVALSGGEGLSKAAALELTIEWDPSILEVTGIAAGPWNNDPSDVRFEASRTSGHATLQFGRKAEKVGLPSGLLAQLEVRALAPGEALVRVSAGAAAGASGALHPVVESTLIKVGAPEEK